MRAHTCVLTPSEGPGAPVPGTWGPRLGRRAAAHSQRRRAEQNHRRITGRTQHSEDADGLLVHGVFRLRPQAHVCHARQARGRQERHPQALTPPAGASHVRVYCPTEHAGKAGMQACRHAGMQASRHTGLFAVASRLDASLP
jgi:hypothetical protein